jgi:hypothetical protein
MKEKSIRIVIIQIFNWLVCLSIRNPDDERTTRKIKRIIEEIHQIRVRDFDWISINSSFIL